MNIYLRLFFTFLKIGAVSFGGGYGMISLIHEECLGHGWLTEEELLNFIAVAESTPGPIAVNMATFVGSSQAGVFGSLCATLGVVLPSFLIILAIVAMLKNLLKYEGVKATLAAIRPVIVGLILATSITMFLSVICNVKELSSGAVLDWKGLGIFTLLAVFAFGYQKWKKKAISPIFLILLSGVFGVILYL